MSEKVKIKEEIWLIRKKWRGCGRIRRRLPCIASLGVRQRARGGGAGAADVLVFSYPCDGRQGRLHY